MTMSKKRSEHIKKRLKRENVENIFLNVVRFELSFAFPRAAVIRNP